MMLLQVEKEKAAEAAPEKGGVDADALRRQPQHHAAGDLMLVLLLVISEWRTDG